MKTISINIPDAVYDALNKFNVYDPNVNQADWTVESYAAFILENDLYFDIKCG